MLFIPLAPCFRWTAVGAGSLAEAEGRHTPNEPSFQKNGTLWRLGCAGRLLKPLLKANRWHTKKLLCNTHVWGQTEGCLKSILNGLNSGLFTSRTVLQGGQEQPMSWGQQENQGKVAFYPCQLHQVLLLLVTWLWPRWRAWTVFHHCGRRVKDAATEEQAAGLSFMVFTAGLLLGVGFEPRSPWASSASLRERRDLSTGGMELDVDAEEHPAFTWSANVQVGRLRRY